VKQKTIRNTISISGTGLHSGVKTNLKIKSAKKNTGIIFIRVDLKQKTRVPALLENVYSTKRSTNLIKNRVKIKTVEHLLAALTGNGIDNVIIEIDNVEVPILDGSSKLFTELISKAETIELDEEKDFITITKEIKIEDQASGTIIKASPSNNYELIVNINYNNYIKQKAQLNSIKEFNCSIANARTFCFFHELEFLINNNLIKGGSLDNAVVIASQEVRKVELEKLSKFFNAKNVKINKNNMLNNTKPRHQNEAARHKLLDLIGDLTLIGKSIKGKIHAYMPGHKNNIKFAKELIKLI